MRQLYVEFLDWADTYDKPIARRAFFAKIFRETNLGLFQPKKDQCDVCSSFRTGNLSHADYEIHREKVRIAREEKARDKEGSAEFMFSADLQCVLLSPKLLTSAQYYKTKLCVHNETVYFYGDHSALCYVWHEAEGGLSGSVFATIFGKFIDRLFRLDPEKYAGQELIFYSDGCTYQNRNALVASAMSSAAVKHSITIIQKFLEKGHTQMECDNVHSVLERKIRKKGEIYVPAQYVELMQTKYHVEYLDFNFFENYDGGPVKSIRPGRKQGDPVVTDLRALKYNSDGSIDFKLDFRHEWSRLPQRQNRWTGAGPQYQPTKLYSEKLPIDGTKYQHLQQMKPMIPADYHNFYDTLPHN